MLNSLNFSDYCSINEESVKTDAIVSGKISACLDDIKSDVHFAEQGGEQSFETHVSDNGFIYTFSETSHGNASDNFEFEGGNQISNFEYLKMGFQFSALIIIQKSEYPIFMLNWRKVNSNMF